jgi:catechol 2,3-dioxygenase-like lactoylglutathione lyase family enzyme
MKIKEVELFCDDLDSAEKFYKDALGLTVSRSGELLQVTAGTSLLIFKFTPSLLPVYHFAFNIPCNKTREALEWLRTRVNLISPGDNNEIVDFSNWHAESVYFYDANGNILEFISRFDLKNEREGDFEGNFILSISEIGIATDDVYTFTENLKEQYGIGLFKMQPRLKNFAAMGDHDGLIIVSKEGRNWFPTSKKAERFPVSLGLIVNDRPIRLSFD